MTNRTRQHIIVHAMALGAALLAAHTALTAIATLERLAGSQHPYTEAWLIVLTPFVLFPLLAQYLLNMASGYMKGPADLSGWDGIERRGAGAARSPDEVAAGAATVAAEEAAHADHAAELAAVTDKAEANAKAGEEGGK